MDFESPDVEREFPGLYASESGSGKRSQESDFSDDAHERSTKKDLLIGKRKDKKESKKDQGYAALEGESSPEEDVDIKSPCKSKKSKSFKFPTIKEKREKSREKDSKEKDKDRDREKDKERDRDVDRDKEKKKESKSKLKLKDKKKIKTGDDATESVEEMPVFGVPLAVAVERSHCHDGIEIPVVVRDCIDHVQDCGLLTESIYKISGIKSKVQQLRRSYNKREIVKLNDYDNPTVTSLLKTFLRELPEPILTTDLALKFEDAANIKELAAREQELLSLVTQIPSCNLLCLSWILRHLENVAANESQNKMSVAALGSVFGPVFQTSPRVVTSLLSHCSSLFPKVKLVRYVPPLSSGCTSLPSTKEAIAAELIKQDSLLNQIHSEMNHGYTVRSDQLWEVQRFITLLKRKLRTIEKAQEAATQPSEKAPAKSEPPVALTSNKTAPISPLGDKIDFQLQTAAEENCIKGGPGSEAEELENIGEADVTTTTPCKDDEDEGARAPDPDAPAPAEPAAAATTASAPATSMATSAALSVQDAAATSVTCPTVAPAPAPATTTIPITGTGTTPVTAPTAVSDQSDHTSGSESEEKGCELQHELEHIELMRLQNFLVSRLSLEREKLEDLRAELKMSTCAQVESSVHNTASINSDANVPVESAVNEADGDWGEWKKERIELAEENERLLLDRYNLVRQIMFERKACINLRVQLEELKQLAETK